MAGICKTKSLRWQWERCNEQAGPTWPSSPYGIRRHKRRIERDFPMEEPCNSGEQFKQKEREKNLGERLSRVPEQASALPFARLENQPVNSANCIWPRERFEQKRQAKCVRTTFHRRTTVCAVCLLTICSFKRSVSILTWS